ncbi:F-box/LRR-repeat protein 5 [Elysia marginata]|uniref:F-box/LRR-repeat protein 5 n=1 Tax=Elysia marginata TaxID=1093978 RepID=A0AAV4I4F5_9GAST|nr:F-box/LRR-repeat protein 5 [Elysia marginata]
MLPKVGSGVQVFDLAFSRGLSNNLVHKILKLCPNLEVLRLQQTLVGDAAFREFGVNGRVSKLRHLDLSGCVNISDLTLFSLASSSTNVAAFRESERKENVGVGTTHSSNLEGEDSDMSEPDVENCHREVVRNLIETENGQQACETKKRSQCKNGINKSLSPNRFRASGDTDASSFHSCASLCQAEVLCDGFSKHGLKEDFFNDNIKNKKTCCSSDTRNVLISKRCDHKSVSASCSDEESENEQCVRCVSSQGKTQTSSCGSRSEENRDPLLGDLNNDLLDVMIQSGDAAVSSDACYLNNKDLDSFHNNPSFSFQSDYQSNNFLHKSQISIGCVDSTDSSKYDNKVPGAAFSIEFLSLSGCYHITSKGIR